MQITEPKLRVKFQDLFAVISDISQTLVTFVAAKITSLSLAQASHTYADTTAWTLSAAEQAKTILNAGGTSGGAADIVATPTLDKVFIVKNTSGSNVVIKASGQSGVTVADGATAIVVGNGTDFV